jgi:hypothetical protein
VSSPWFAAARRSGNPGPTASLLSTITTSRCPPPSAACGGSVSDSNQHRLEPRLSAKVAPDVRVLRLPRRLYSRDSRAGSNSNWPRDDYEARTVSWPRTRAKSVWPFTLMPARPDSRGGLCLPTRRATRATITTAKYLRITRLPTTRSAACAYASGWRQGSLIVPVAASEDAIGHTFAYQATPPPARGPLITHGRRTAFRGRLKAGARKSRPTSMASIKGHSSHW